MKIGDTLNATGRRALTVLADAVLIVVQLFVIAGLVSYGGMGIGFGRTAPTAPGDRFLPW